MKNANTSRYNIKENQSLHQIFEFFDIIELFCQSSVFFDSCYSKIVILGWKEKKINKYDRGNSLKAADSFPLTMAKQESEYTLENERWEREKKKKKKEIA